jgi:hypothetical protein
MSSFVRCPDCGTKVYFQDEQPGDRLRCDECGRRFTWLADDDAEHRLQRRSDRSRSISDRIETGMRRIRRKRPHTPWYLFPLAGLPLLIPPTIWVAGLISGANFAPLGYIGLAIGLFITAACLVLALLPWSTLGRLITVGALCFAACAGGLGLGFFQLIAMHIQPDDDWEYVENSWGFEVEMPKDRVPGTESNEVRGKRFPLQKLTARLNPKDMVIELKWGDPPYFNGVFDDQIYDKCHSELSARGVLEHAGKSFIEAHRVFDFYLRRTDGRGYELTRIYVARRMGKLRLFTLTLAGPTVNPDCPEAKRFLDSFHPGEF